MLAPVDLYDELFSGTTIADENPIHRNELKNRGQSHITVLL